MKTLVIILLLVISNLTLWATDYYVKNSGNNSSNGLSDATAWANLSKVNNHVFSAGDRILFKRGNTFRGDLIVNSSGSKGIPITYSAYGSGNKPKILGSKDLSSVSEWTLSSGNIWKTTARLGVNIGNHGDCANLIFNNETGYGVKKTSLGNCTSQGDWYYNPNAGTDNLVYIYSVSNPGSYYSHIEAGGVYNKEQVITIEGKSDITIQNLDIRYSANNGIVAGWGVSNITIEHCDVSWIGGMYVTNAYPERMGNGIGVWDKGSNITIRYNRVDQCYDSGISPQGGRTMNISNINIYYNIITNCLFCYEFWVESGATAIGINFYNNTCINAGSQWSMGQRPDNTDNSHHVMIWELTGTVSSCNIKNNIFKTCLNQSVYIYGDESKISIDYNLYNVNVVGIINSSKIYTTLDQWRSATSQDTHSLSGDPVFASSSDYHLKSSSPAIYAGATLGLNTDYDGVFTGSHPDIGAYEYVSSNY